MYVTDPLTFEEVPVSDTLTVISGKTKTVYGKRSLLEYVVTSGKSVSPLSTVELDEDAVRSLMEYRESNYLRLTITDENEPWYSESYTTSAVVDSFALTGDVMVSICRSMGSISKLLLTKVRVDEDELICLYDLPLNTPLHTLSSTREIRLRVMKGVRPSNQELTLLYKFVSSYSRHYCVSVYLADVLRAMGIVLPSEL